MIEASFDRLSRRAAIDGAYQYDTGQRLRLSGLPSPDELAEEDDFIAGDTVTVQAQYGYVGDLQTKSTLAMWDSMRDVWLADIPEEYLTKNEPVNVYVFVYYGETENEARGQTKYEGVFTPAYRPAPNNVATDDMLDAWGDLVGEVDLVLAASDEAKQNADENAQRAETAAKSAEEAAQDAQSAADEAEKHTGRLEALGVLWGGMDVLVESLPAGTEATASLDGGVLTLGAPVGEQGPQGAVGATGPADISLTMTDGVLTITPR